MDPDDTVVFMFTSDGMGQTQEQALRDKLADTFLRLEEADRPLSCARQAPGESRAQQGQSICCHVMFC